MARTTLSYTHGDTGTEPANSLNFEQNERPNSGHFDWFWHSVSDALGDHADEFERLDSDNDGVVDAADGAATWSQGGTTQITHPTDIDFTGDITVSADGDGTATVNVSTLSDNDVRNAVDGSSVSINGDADTVDGSHAADFAASGHLHDGRYIRESGDTMQGALGMGGNSLTGAGQIDGNAGNNRLDFTSDASQIEVHDHSGSRSDLAAADVYVDDGIGWLSNAVNAGGAVSAVNAEDSLSVDISGDADTIRGFEVVSNNGDALDAPSYATMSDVPTLSAGEIVYVEDENAHYFEDGS